MVTCPPSSSSSSFSLPSPALARGRIADAHNRAVPVRQETFVHVHVLDGERDRNVALGAAHAEVEPRAQIQLELGPLAVPANPQEEVRLRDRPCTKAKHHDQPARSNEQDTGVPTKLRTTTTTTTTKTRPQQAMPFGRSHVHDSANEVGKSQYVGWVVCKPCVGCSGATHRVVFVLLDVVQVSRVEVTRERYHGCLGGCFEIPRLPMC